MEKYITLWKEVTALSAGMIAITLGTMKGLFITKKDCANTREMCSGGMNDTLTGIKLSLDKIQDRSRNTESFIVFLAAKEGIKPEDIPKL